MPRSRRSSRPCGDASRPPLLKTTSVQVRPRLQHLDQHLPRGAAFGWIPLSYGKVGAEGLAVFRKRKLQFLGNRMRSRFQHTPWAKNSSPIRAMRTSSKVRTGDGSGSRSGSRITLLDAILEKFLALDISTIQDRACLDERVGRHNQAGRLDEAEPFQVVPYLRRELLSHPRHPVSGHRYTRPTGSTRLARTLVEVSYSLGFGLQIALELFQSMPPGALVGVKLALVGGIQAQSELVRLGLMPLKFVLHSLPLLQQGVSCSSFASRSPRSSQLFEWPSPPVPSALGSSCGRNCSMSSAADRRSRSRMILLGWEAAPRSRTSSRRASVFRSASISVAHARGSARRCGSTQRAVTVTISSCKRSARSPYRDSRPSRTTRRTESATCARQARERSLWTKPWARKRASRRWATRCSKMQVNDVLRQLTRVLEDDGPDRSFLPPLQRLLVTLDRDSEGVQRGGPRRICGYPPGQFRESPHVAPPLRPALSCRGLSVLNA